MSSGVVSNPNASASGSVVEDVTVVVVALSFSFSLLSEGEIVLGLRGCCVRELAAGVVVPGVLWTVLELVASFCFAEGATAVVLIGLLGLAGVSCIDVPLEGRGGGGGERLWEGGFEVGVVGVSRELVTGETGEGEGGGGGEGESFEAVLGGSGSCVEVTWGGVGEGDGEGCGALT